MSNSGILCFNYAQMELLNERTRKLKDSISYAILREQWVGTKLPGKVIARTRSYIANLWGVSLSTATRRLCKFKEHGFISGKVGMWYGDKRLFISCDYGIDVGINLKKVLLLTEYTGSHEASFMLSLLAFNSQKNDWAYEGKRWSRFSKAKLAKIVTADIKTCDAMMRDLSKKGLIEYRVENALGEKRSERHYVVHIKNEFERTFAESWKALKEKDLADKMEKMNLSITVDKLEVGYINNNNTGGGVKTEESIVIFTKKIQNYVSAAISRTLVRCQHAAFDAVTLLAHVKYLLTGPNRGPGMKDFVHVVNRVMFLVRKGAWKVPFGFFKYCEEGRKMALEMEPMNPVVKCTVKGEGTIMMWDYAVEDKTIPYPADIVAERIRLENLHVSREEVNHGLVSKFGEYGRSYFLKEPVSSQTPDIKRGWRSKFSAAEWAQLAETDPVIKKALESYVS